MKATKSPAKVSAHMTGLSCYIASALRRPLPGPVAEKTRHHLLDTIAAMVSGSRLTPGRKAIAYAKSLGGAKEATVAGFRCVTTAVNAALANGMLPQPLVGRLNGDMVKAIQSTELRSKGAEEGFELVGSSPKEFAATLRKQSDLVGRIAKAANIQPTDH